MAVERMTEQQIETRLRIVEQWMGRADAKDLKCLNVIHRRLMNELVRRDMGGRNFLTTERGPDTTFFGDD
jgi:hypothetical protein